MDNMDKLERKAREERESSEYWRKIVNRELALHPEGFNIQVSRTMADAIEALLEADGIPVYKSRKTLFIAETYNDLLTHIEYMDAMEGE